MNGKKTGSQRRQFIKQGLLGLAGVASAPAIIKANNQKNIPDNVITRPLGKTGISLPIISMGAGNYDPNLYKIAMDRGITHIDTSPYYSNGKHERVVGDVIKDRPRHSVIIATSVLIGKETTAITMSLKDAATLSARLEKSLRRLKTDYVDIFYVAGVSSKEIVEHPTLLSQLKQLKKSGKIRFAGVATHQNEAETIEAIIKLGFHDVVLSAYNFRQSHHENIKRAMTKASDAGIGIIAMKTMAGGFWDKAQKLPINGKAALKWALRDSCVHSAIPAIKTLEQLETDLSIMKQPALSPEEKSSLKLGDKLSLTGLYCQQCGTCTAGCPHDLEIPVLMRSYMYAYGYKDLAKARNTLDEADLSRMKCADCAHCTIKCSMGFDVPGKVLDIARLKDVPKEFLA